MCRIPSLSLVVSGRDTYPAESSPGGADVVGRRSDAKKELSVLRVGVRDSIAPFP